MRQQFLALVSDAALVGGVAFMFLAGTAACVCYTGIIINWLVEVGRTLRKNACWPR